MTSNDGQDAEGRKSLTTLAHLLGIREEEAADRSLGGRLALIARLKAAKRMETTRGKAGSWLYDVNRHLALCVALRMERRALAVFLAAGDAAEPRVAID